MRVRNTADAYGAVSIVLHWLVAVVVIGLLASGLWMVGLGYYDPWYHRAPALHKAFGVLLAMVVVARIAWRWAGRTPAPAPGVRPWEARAAHLVHGLLDVGVVVSIVSGYLITTAKGDAVDVFGLFSVPATLHGLPRQADVAGEVHYLVGLALIALATVHALAALKHHLVDRDATLARMLGRAPARRPPRP